MRPYLFFTACLAAVPVSGPVAAQVPLPALYDVTGVASDDTLNIRTDPSSDADDIGDLAYDARDIEVTARSQDGRWGRINSGEGTGWVSMQFLTETDAASDSNTRWSALGCFGTEPFWSVDLWSEKTISFAEAMGDSAVYRRTHAYRSGYLGGSVAYDGALDGATISAVISPVECSDGMSDRLFGLRAVILQSGPQGDRLFEGCCSIDPN